MQLTELETALINRLRQLNDTAPVQYVGTIDTAVDYDADRKAWADHYADILKLFAGVNYVENEQVETEYYRSETMAVVEHFADRLAELAHSVEPGWNHHSLDHLLNWLTNRLAAANSKLVSPPPALDNIIILYAELFGSRTTYPDAEQMRIEIRNYVTAFKHAANEPLVWLYRDVFGKQPADLMPFDQMYREIWKEVQTWRTPSSEPVNLLNSMCDFVYSMDECYFAIDNDEDAPIRPQTWIECKTAIETMFDSVNSQIMQMVRSHHVKLPPTQVGKPLTLIQLLIELDDHFSKPQVTK